MKYTLLIATMLTGALALPTPTTLTGEALEKKLEILNAPEPWEKREGKLAVLSDISKLICSCEAATIELMARDPQKVSNREAQKVSNREAAPQKVSNREAAPQKVSNREAQKVSNREAAPQKVSN
ncbi:hypothetical protein COCC4DRAFT_54358 [Bipolaris maydis ATCC 48331]|uniref:Uncharacterized protein n=1 Tax=Cochliobolus heterostrophus (strain C4 / ATCC 48331 / race T) TaxID=665024 RepID=N4WYM2_COCH4|nr:uncharacterized protein COCC4DRAFT_54358 [Bipolaris maydis ATCC 48331]ENH99470.1 hypothetical protein COCC4DRAFT_54358 [Bipolaris maydis ATCC 48331]